MYLITNLKYEYGNICDLAENQLINDKNIQGIIEKAKKDKEVLAVALFGSYARGEEYKDIDICISLKNKSYDKQYLAKKRFQYTLTNEKYDVQIFQLLPIYIRKRILKEGKILYCIDENNLYDIYLFTIEEFEDFKPLYESYLEAVESG